MIASPHSMYTIFIPSYRYTTYTLVHAYNTSIHTESWSLFSWKDNDIRSLVRRFVRSFARLPLPQSQRNRLTLLPLLYTHNLQKYIATALALTMTVVRVPSKCDTIFVRLIVCAVRRFAMAMVMVREISGTWFGTTGQRLAGRLADRRHNISSASSNNNNSSNTTYTGLSSTQSANGIELTQKRILYSF